MSFQKNTEDTDNAEFDPDRFAQMLESLQQNSQLVAKDPKHLANMHLNLDIAFSLMRAVRDLKSKEFKKTFTEQQLIEHFCNQTQYKKLNEESPGLFICAINEKLDSGEPQKLVNLIAKGNGDGEATALLMNAFAADLSNDFKTKVAQARENLKNETAPDLKKVTVVEEKKKDVPVQSQASKEHREKVLREQARVQELLEKFRRDKSQK